MATAWIVAAVLFLPAVFVLIYRFAPPPMTPLMIIRAAEGHERSYEWVPLTRISPFLARAVIASEDQNFCSHYGFDVESIRRAWENYGDGEGTLRGGSTISQQTAKNAFLWPDRSWLRKGLETWFTFYIEALWNKPRILEIYLNIVEWGPGVYGAEAAAKYHFDKSASRLNAQEAALLATVLPSPRNWSASNPGPYVQSRARVISGRAAKLGPLTGCLQAD
ncbi:MAG: monofunctional biosynthetic peptidoglycan transglycosylase [Rhodospirillaceae bacterium]